MYDFPLPVELGSLVGQSLVQVCASANQISLFFGQSGSITALGDVRQEDELGTSATFAAPAPSLSLFRLIEQRIEKLEVIDRRRVLKLWFSNRHTLTFTSDTYYESVHIEVDAQTYIV